MTTSLQLSPNYSFVDCGPRSTFSRSIDWLPNSSNQVCFASSPSVTVWNVDASREAATFSGHNGPIHKVAAITNNSLLSAGSDKTVRLWDVRSEKQAVIKNNVHVKDWAVQDTFVVVLEHGPGAAVKVYDSRKWTDVLNSQRLDGSIPESCAISPSAETIAVGTSSTDTGMADIRAWHWKAGGDKIMMTDTDNETTIHPAHAGPIYTIQYSLDGRRLASGGSDAIVGLWDTEHMCCFATVDKRTKFLRSVAFSHDSTLLAVASEEDTVDVCDAHSGTVVGTIPFPHKYMGAEDLCFHPRHKYWLACAMLNSDRYEKIAPVSVIKLNVATTGQ